MPADSAPVTSRQTQPHPSLEAVVLKHRDAPWKKPIADHSKRAWDEVRGVVEAWGGPLILDTGCGTGMSTRRLAARNPEALVLGVDKSVDRLSRGGPVGPNARLVRADLEDFWRLCAEAGWRFSQQCFFYPNPWPKPEQRLRRWAFHPVLPAALACGGVWEVRTNWDVYALEFAQAFGILTGTTPQVERWSPSDPDSLFEKKYRESGHALWRWVAPVTSPPS